MDNMQILSDWSAQVEAELTKNILPFWVSRVMDRERGGFYGAISNDLVVDRNVRRGVLLSSRILWTFSAAYKRYRRPEFLAMAYHAYDDLKTNFVDQDYGGLFWEIEADGTVSNERKQVYGQAFGIYGLVEFYRATNELPALGKSVDIFTLVDHHGHDSLHGGYLEALTRRWQPEQDVRLSARDRNEPKSMNTHLHLMEALTNLRRVWPDERVTSRHRELIELMMRRIVDPQTAHMTLFFDEAWQPRSTEISYGHDIEASWLLVEAAEVDGDPALIQEAKALALRMAQAVYEQALDTDGGLMYEAGPHGWIDDSKEWWPQAEAVVGFLNAYQISGQPHFLNAALKSWAFIQQHLIDRQHGEWFRGVLRDGTLKANELKVSFWKCPYHNGRMCMEVIDRLAALRNRSG